MPYIIMKEELVKGIALTVRSKNRKKILAYLENGIKTPSKIAKETKIDNSHVSKYLKSMKEAGLVVCLNEDDKQGRLYQITALGKEVDKSVDAEFDEMQ